MFFINMLLWRYLWWVSFFVLQEKSPPAKGNALTFSRDIFMHTSKQSSLDTDFFFFLGCAWQSKQNLQFLLQLHFGYILRRKRFYQIWQNETFYIHCTVLPTQTFCYLPFKTCNVVFWPHEGRWFLQGKKEKANLYNL